MEYVLSAARVGLFARFRLSVLVMTLLAASDPDDLPEPVPAPTPAGRASWLDLRESRVGVRGVSPGDIFGRVPPGVSRDRCRTPA